MTISEIEDFRKMIMYNDRFTTTGTMNHSNPCMEIDLQVPKMWESKEENTNWEFHSSSESDINWDDIKDSLTYAEPLALVTRTMRDRDENGNKIVYNYVVIDEQLWNKALSVGEGVEDVPTVVDTVAKRVFYIENKFSDWVQWAKGVKASNWPDPEKSTVKVVLPTI